MFCSPFLGFGPPAPDEKEKRHGPKFQPMALVAAFKFCLSLLDRCPGWNLRGGGL
jgi:hypothetical protein